MASRPAHMEFANGSRDWRAAVPPNLVPCWFVEGPWTLSPQPDEATARKVAERHDSDVYRAVRLWREA